MKLHLPKLLRVALLSAMAAGFASTAHAADLTLTSKPKGEDTLWDVGVPEHTLDPVTVTNKKYMPQYHVSYDATTNGVQVDGYDEKVFLLDGNDQLGI